MHSDNALNVALVSKWCDVMAFPLKGRVLQYRLRRPSLPSSAPIRLTTGRFTSSGKQSSPLDAVCCFAKYVLAFVFNGNEFKDWVINFEAAARNAKSHLPQYVAPYSRKVECYSSTLAQEL